MTKDELQSVNEYLSKKSIVSDYELRNYADDNFNIKDDKNYHYFLSELYKNNILYKYDSKSYKSCIGKKDFTFERTIDNDVMMALENIDPKVNISIWNISDLNRYMSLQLFSDIKFVETHKYARDVVVNLLYGLGKNVVLEEDYETLIKYKKYDDIYIVRKINDDSPIVKSRFLETSADKTKKSIITYPKIEKILVDIIVNKLFDKILGDEVYNIICNILKSFKINMATIKRYAAKKHVWSGVKFVIESTGFNIEMGDF